MVMMDSLEFIDEASAGFVPCLADTATLFYQLFGDVPGYLIDRQIANLIDVSKQK